MTKRRICFLAVESLGGPCIYLDWPHYCHPSWVLLFPLGASADPFGEGASVVCSLALYVNGLTQMFGLLYRNICSSCPINSQCWESRDRKFHFCIAVYHGRADMSGNLQSTPFYWGACGGCHEHGREWGCLFVREGKKIQRQGFSKRAALYQVWYGSRNRMQSSSRILFIYSLSKVYASKLCVYEAAFK